MKRRWQDLFDDNRSIWVAGKEPYTKAPSLTRDTTVDVAIIGGGFTGVSTAYHLSKRFPDRGIAILEARMLANGASGRNGGQMLNWAHGFESADPEMAGRIYGATREAIAGILAIIDEHGLDVPFRRDGHLDVFTDPRTADAAAAETEALAGAGLPVRYLDRSELRAHIELDGVEGAMLDPEGGALDGVAFLRGLRPVLEGRGVRIFEETPVLRVREGPRIELETPAAKVRADAVVLATNAYTPHLGYFRHALVPIHSHVIGTEARDGGAWDELGWKRSSSFTDDRNRLSYGTLTPSGGLVFGGGSNATYDYRYGNGTRFPAEGANPGFEACRRHLVDYLPRLEVVPIRHRWTGAVAVTLSRLSAMGVRGEHRNVYYALGYSGHGVTLSNLAGKILTDVYSRSDDRWRQLPFVQRSLRFIPPEPFRWLGYQTYTRLTGRSPRTRS